MLRIALAGIVVVGVSILSCSGDSRDSQQQSTAASVAPTLEECTFAAEMLLDAYDAGGLIKAAVSVMRDPELTLTAKNEAVEEHLASIRNVLTAGPSPPDSLATAYSLLVAANTHAEEAFLHLLASAPAEDIALVREAGEELELASVAVDDFYSELETFLSSRAPGHCPSELIEPRS